MLYLHNSNHTINNNKIILLGQSETNSFGVTAVGFPVHVGHRLGFLFLYSLIITNRTLLVIYYFDFCEDL